MSDEFEFRQKPAQKPQEPRDIPHTTVARESRAKSSGSGMGIVFAVILLVAAIAAIYVFNQQSTSEVSRGETITPAAAKTASNLGDAAKDTAQKASGPTSDEHSNGQ